MRDVDQTSWADLLSEAAFPLVCPRCGAQTRGLRCTACAKSLAQAKAVVPAHLVQRLRADPEAFAEQMFTNPPPQIHETHDPRTTSWEARAEWRERAYRDGAPCRGCGRHVTPSGDPPLLLCEPCGAVVMKPPGPLGYSFDGEWFPTHEAAAGARQEHMVAEAETVIASRTFGYWMRQESEEWTATGRHDRGRELLKILGWGLEDPSACEQCTRAALEARAAAEQQPGDHLLVLRDRIDELRACRQGDCSRGGAPATAATADGDPPSAPAAEPRQRRGWLAGIAQMLDGLAEAQSQRQAHERRPAAPRRGGIVGTAAVGGLALAGGLTPAGGASTKGVSRSDVVVGDGGNCTIYRRSDGSHYALDRYGRIAEHSGSRVNGPAKFDTREKYARATGRRY